MFVIKYTGIESRWPISKLQIDTKDRMSIQDPWPKS